MPVFIHGGGGGADPIIWVNEAGKIQIGTGTKDIVIPGNIGVQGTATLTKTIVPGPSDVQTEIYHRNSSWLHHETNAARGFWFNKDVAVQGDILAGPEYDKTVWHSGNLPVEEGEWTPTFTNLAGAAITYTGTPTGTYTRHGSMVHIKLRWRGKINSVPAESYMCIRGLPFQGYNRSFIPIGNHYDCTNQDTSLIWAEVSNSMLIGRTTSGSATVVWAVSAVTQYPSDLHFDGWYQIDY